ncbi:hypothetical protein [Micromonospora sp. WMMD980]|uniref:hypothetical protein n=1 Tax=Micromonospora sp. WMMD980 TaxID=3016088 RepID=UPI00241684B7|nr:hypothetical protein [Micromonospora sp. WMMD980]MDG4799047.1 hypothetical protein [Micromonospora sp. WMMD980]
MAVSLVGTPSSGNTAAGTSNSLPTSLPSGWAAGDVAILVGHLSGGSLNMSTPAGWTSLPGVSWPVTESTSSRMYAWYRVLQSGDSAPTISINGAMTGGWELLVFRDASGVAQAATATASGTAATLPTLTGVLAGSAVVEAAHVRVTSGTIPTGLTPNVAYTEVIDHATSRSTGSANVRMNASYRLIGSAGSYGGEQVTSDVTGSMVAVLVELAAASVDATVAPAGVSVPAEVGSPSVDGTLAAGPTGLTVAASLGSPSVDGAVGVTPGGVSLPVAVGLPGASWAVEAAPAGVLVSVTFGAPGILGAGASSDELLVPAEVGSPSVLWAADVVPDGLATDVEVGAPDLAWSVEVALDGVDVSVEVGEPSLAAPPAVGGPGALTATTRSPALTARTGGPRLTASAAAARLTPTTWP